MPKVDFLLYAVHNAFWAAFGLTLLILRWMDRNRTADSETAPVAKQEQTAPGKTAPFSRALLAFHGLAFALMYFGIGFAVVPWRVPRWFPGQRGVGTVVIAAGAAVMVWGFLRFRLCRFRPPLCSVHTLAAGRPLPHLSHHLS